MSTIPIEKNKLSALAKDLSKAPPRSPRETLGGYVIAARTLDKCRAMLNGTQGDYNFGQYMDNLFFSFSGISATAFKAYVATGATDEEVAEWIRLNARQNDPIEVVKWNNQCRYSTPKDMPEPFQLFMEDYIAQNVPRHRPVYHVFDIFDLEENRL